MRCLGPWLALSRDFVTVTASASARQCRRPACSKAGAGATTSARGINLSDFPPERIRSFAIIAHIDHGKTSLADRLLEHTGCIPATNDKDRKMVLDKLKVERERGITVQAQTASMIYHHPHDPSGQPYILNLLDTPGHVSNQLHGSSWQTPTIEYRSTSRLKSTEVFWQRKVPCC